MEIVENDLLDENTGKEEYFANKEKNKENKPANKPVNNTGKITEGQVKRLYVLGSGKDTALIKEMLKSYGFNSAVDITKDKYKLFGLTWSKFNI